MNLLISAGPGCGKSHTIKTAFQALFLSDDKLSGPISEEQSVIYDWVRANLPKPTSGKTLYLAFQRSIADKLKKELPPVVDVYSLNGFGHSRVLKVNGYQKINHNRGLILLEKILNKPITAYDYKTQKDFKNLLVFIRKLKQEDLMPCNESFEYVQQKYVETMDLALPTDGEVELSQELMRRMAIPNNQVEYIDQLWLGEKCVRGKPYDIAFVDEFQDLSQIMLKLAYKAAHHIVFCGDPNQSITRFAGAGDAIYEELQLTCDKELPLRLSFRLPPNITQKANQIHPSAKLRSSKTAKGEDRSVPFDAIPQLASPPGKSAVLCRTNAPLVAAALSLINTGFPCYILKTDLIEQLSTLLTYKSAEAIGMLRRQLDQTQKPIQKMIIQDKISILENLQDEPNPKKRLEDLCKPSSDKLVLTTIHKAKGLEWKNVFILNPPIPHPSAQRPEEQNQEKNIEYVAITRTLENLYWTEL